jgi:hypothetical protein
MDPVMLQKCANPDCIAPFRSLREGKLFLAELRQAERRPVSAGRRAQRRREHFWLCQECSGQFTLRFDSEIGVLTVPLSPEAPSRFLTAHAS